MKGNVELTSFYLSPFPWLYIFLYQAYMCPVSCTAICLFAVKLVVGCTWHLFLLLRINARYSNHQYGGHHFQVLPDAPRSYPDAPPL
jgi:hypothetical protein